MYSSVVSAAEAVAAEAEAAERSCGGAETAAQAVWTVKSVLCLTSRCGRVVLRLLSQTQLPLLLVLSRFRLLRPTVWLRLGFRLCSLRLLLHSRLAVLLLLRLLLLLLCLRLGLVEGAQFSS